MNWLNYHHLYYFYVIATEGSVTKATDKLKLAQSTLSAQLKQFEDTIGHQLFERKNRRLILTDVGRRVYQYAHEIFSLGQELKDSLANFEDTLKVKVRLGVMNTIPHTLIEALVDTVAVDHGARVSLVQGSMLELVNQLQDHELDLLFTNDKPPAAEMGVALHCRLIGEMPVVFVSAPKFYELKTGFPHSLTGRPFILPAASSPLHREIIEHLRIKHVEPTMVAEIADLETQKHLAMCGLGITALPLKAAEDELAQGQLVRLSETPICHESLWLVASHRLVHNPVAQALLKSFRPS